jgi:hypothetical protein
MNPSAIMIRDFFMTFGFKLTHICCFICVTPVADPREHIAWESMPNLREIVTHPAVQFRGSAPKGSKLERVVITRLTEESKRWISETFDPTFASRSGVVQIDSTSETKSTRLTICLGSVRWPEGVCALDSSSTRFEQGHDLASFCEARGWKLEDGKGQRWMQLGLS